MASMALRFRRGVSLTDFGLVPVYGLTESAHPRRRSRAVHDGPDPGLGIVVGDKQHLVALFEDVVWFWENDPATAQYCHQGAVRGWRQIANPRPDQRVF